MILKTLLTAVAAAGLLYTGANPASAQSYPDRPITIYVGLAAGGGTDLLARAIADNMQRTLGQPVVVENLPGASGTIAGQKVATANPDGYTLLVVSASEAILPSIRDDLPYDLRKAFAPIDVLSESPYLVTVTNSFSAKSLKDFIDVAKASPGTVNYGTAGVGSHAHIVTAALGLQAGIDMAHIPFKGNAEASVAVASGTVDLSLITPTTAGPLIEAGKIRPLAITSQERANSFPDVPTVSEAGLPGFAYGTWYALLTTANTPDAVVAKLHDATEKALASPELANFLKTNGMTKRGGTSAAAAEFINSEVDRYGKVIKDAGIKIE